MVMNLNKRGFLNELSHILSYSEDECIMIHDILEDNFFLSKKNKDKVINELIQKLEINHEEAVMVYDVATKIVNKEIKDKLKHPFRSRD